MKNFKNLAPDKMLDRSKYEPAGSGIYKDLNDEMGFAAYRMGVTMELEEGDGSQYPLEDILDKYFVHVAEFIDKGGPGKAMYLLLGGELDSLRNFLSIIGKWAYNVHYEDEEGRGRAKLVIE